MDLRGDFLDWLKTIHEDGRISSSESFISLTFSHTSLSTRSSLG